MNSDTSKNEHVNYKRAPGQIAAEARPESMGVNLAAIVGGVGLLATTALVAGLTNESGVKTQSPSPQQENTVQEKVIGADQIDQSGIQSDINGVPNSITIPAPVNETAILPPVVETTAQPQAPILGDPSSNGKYPE